MFSDAPKLQPISKGKATNTAGSKNAVSIATTTNTSTTTSTNHKKNFYEKMARNNSEFSFEMKSYNNFNANENNRFSYKTNRGRNFNSYHHRNSYENSAQKEYIINFYNSASTSFGNTYKRYNRSGSRFNDRFYNSAFHFDCLNPELITPNNKLYTNYNDFRTKQRFQNHQIVQGQQRFPINNTNPPTNNKSNHIKLIKSTAFKATTKKDCTKKPSNGSGLKKIQINNKSKAKDKIINSSVTNTLNNNNNKQKILTKNNNTKHKDKIKKNSANSYTSEGIHFAKDDAFRDSDIIQKPEESVLEKFSNSTSQISAVEREVSSPINTVEAEENLKDCEPEEASTTVQSNSKLIPSPSKLNPLFNEPKELPDESTFEAITDKTNCLEENPQTTTDTIFQGKPINDTTIPKISLIPLSRLMADEFRELEEINSDTNTSIPTLLTKPNKPSFKLNLLHLRKRSQSFCSSTSTTSNPCNTIIEKLTNMDITRIKNIINTADTKYDEALKAQARKRLREEIRRQLKSINFETNKQIMDNDVVPDEIVDSIHIPDAVLDEIRNALGIELFKDIPINDVELSLNMFNKLDEINESSEDVKVSEHFSLIPEAFTNTKAMPPNPQKPLPERNHTPTSTTNCNSIENVNGNNCALSRSVELCLKISPRSKESQQNTSTSKSTISQRKTTTVHERNLKIKEERVEKSEMRARRKLKSLKKRKERQKTAKNHSAKQIKEVIVIDSSSSATSSSSSSSSSTSSSSSNSSSSDSESEKSARSLKSAALKRKRLKLKLDAENVIDSFEKLILPNLSDTLGERYSTKYSVSTSTKLHFISCICASEYNSEKFSKMEIANVQRNLKSPDCGMALDFLMREIVNVFNKQKQRAKAGGGNKKSESKRPISALRKSSSDIITEQKEQSAELNQISSTNVDVETSAKTPAIDDDIRIKECVSKMLSLYKEEMKAALESVKEKNQPKLLNTEVCTNPASPAMVVTPAIEHRNANKVINAGNAGTNGDINPITPNAATNDNSCNKNDSISSKGASQQQQPGCEHSSTMLGRIQVEDKLSADSDSRKVTSTFAAMDYSSLGYSDMNSPTLALVQHSALKSLDLDSFKQKNPVGEAVVNNLREIDLKLMELHKRKMFIEEMILKLQKDKMEVDLLTIKLQNEKFILLNTAMTANAASKEQNATNNVKSNDKKYIKTENTNRPKETTNNGSVSVTRPKNKQIAEECTTTNETNPNSGTKEKKLETLKSSKKDTTAGTTTKRKSISSSPSITEAKCKRLNTRSNDTKSKDKDAIKTTKKQESKTLESAPTSVRVTIPTCNVEGIKSPITQIKVFEKTIVASAEDGKLYKFDAATLKLIKQYDKHTEAITQMYLCMEKKVIYTTSLDGYLKETSLENFELDVLSLYLQEPLQSIDVQWGVVYLGSRWGNIFTYNISDNRLSENLLCSASASIIAIKATKNGKQKILVISSKGNVVQLRDATTGTLIRTLDIAETLNIYSILLDDNTIYCGTQKKEIHKYELSSGLHKGILTCGNGAVSMQIYNNRYIFVGCYDGFIYILDKGSGILKERLPGSGRIILAVEIANNKIITSAKDYTMKAIDIPALCLESVNNKN